MNNINKMRDINSYSCDTDNEIISKNEDIQDIIKNREKKKFSNYFLN
jgi:hypothetical protein